MKAILINGLPHTDSRLDGLDLVQDPDGDYHNYDRGTVCDAIVIHESAGKDPRKRLRANNWGVHFTCWPNGEVHQSCDVARACSHAPGMNRRAVGLEIVSPYYPPTTGLWLDVIDAPWAHKGRYLVPTLAQLEACCVLVDVLTSASWDGVEIPRLFAGNAVGNFALSRDTHHWKQPGITPHCHSIKPLRADGPLVALYCYLRLVEGTHPLEARREAMAIARKGACRKVGGVWWAEVSP